MLRFSKKYTVRFNSWLVLNQNKKRISGFGIFKKIGHFRKKDKFLGQLEKRAITK